MMDDEYIQHHIEIETPHLRSTGMTRYEDCWDELMRQIRIEGVCHKLPNEDSDAYFASRARGSQLGAWASQQSQVVDSRQTLEAAYAEQEQRFAQADVSRPPHWGGYHLSISRIEFWQGRDHRFHDRMVYIRQADAQWQHQRLQP